MRSLGTQDRGRPWVWLALFTVLTVFSTGRWTFIPAAWLVAVFGLRFSRTYPRAGRGYWLLVLAALVGSSLGWSGGTIAGSIHPAFELIFFAITLPIAMLPYAIDRWAVRRITPTGRFAATLVFPLATTTFEYLGDGPLGSFGASAYSQYGWLSLMQLTAVTGLIGVAFLLAWFASLANYVWESGFDWRASARGVAMYGGVLVVVLGFGFARLWLPADAETGVHVVGITVDAEIPERDDPGYEAAVARMHDEYLARTAVAAAAGADIIVWPEGTAFGEPRQTAALMDASKALAKEHGVSLAVTRGLLPNQPEGAAEPILDTIDPNGDVALSHIKYGGTFQAEDGSFELMPTRELQALDTPFGRISGIICWDADFPDTVSQIGDLDVDLLLITANDWYEVRNIHAEMAVFRSIENGVPVFRQAKGVSLATDAYGRVISSTDSFDGVMQQDVNVPLNATATLFPTIGRFFSWAALAGLIGMLAWAWVAGRRRAQLPEATTDFEAEQRKLVGAGHRTA